MRSFSMGVLGSSGVFLSSFLVSGMLLGEGLDVFFVGSNFLFDSVVNLV